MENETNTNWVYGMKPKCPFYRDGVCSTPNECNFIVWHYQKKECRKGGLLRTPTKLKYMEAKQNEPTQKT